MAPSQSLEDFLQLIGERVAEVSQIVSEKRHIKYDLHSPDGAVLTIGPVEDTEYDDRPAVVNAWGEFYLSTITKMEVIGYVEGTPYPCDQLVLMICEDQKMYGFDGKELHLVAYNPDQMSKKGIPYPALQSYYYGKAFKDMTKEDWEEVKLSPVEKRLDEEYRKLMASHKFIFLQRLHNIKQKQKHKDVPDQAAATRAGSAGDAAIERAFCGQPLHHQQYLLKDNIVLKSNMSQLQKVGM